jgi:hypothetical protein
MPADTGDPSADGREVTLVPTGLAYLALLVVLLVLLRV